SGGFSGVEKLSAAHEVGAFNCGSHTLDLWLRKYALANQSAANSPQTYVVHRQGVVVGYYSLIYGEVSLEQCPPRIREAMPSRYPVPVIKMARLAVDKRAQGRGLGIALMKDIFLRSIAAAEIAGLRAIVVDALDEQAKRFYCEKFGFDESPIGPLQLFLRIDDVKAALEASAKGSPGAGD
ncbi:MAG: GNAT family N-acetyltransferase, partial [Terriglobales bacterium]